MAETEAERGGGGGSNKEEGVPLALSPSSSGKKRGRPRKGSEVLLLPKEVRSLGAKRSFGKNKSMLWPLPECSYDGDVAKKGGGAGGVMVGQEVEGVIEAATDSGFLISVRLDNTTQLFRGFIFGPGLSLPLPSSPSANPAFEVSTQPDDDTAHLSIPSADPSPPVLETSVADAEPSITTNAEENPVPQANPQQEIGGALPYSSPPPPYMSHQGYPIPVMAGSYKQTMNAHHPQVC